MLNSLVPSEQLRSSASGDKDGRKKLRRVALFTWSVFYACELNSPPTWGGRVRFGFFFCVNCMAIG